MNPKMKSFQRFIAAALAALFLAPMSLFAESRPLDQTWRQLGSPGASEIRQGRQLSVAHQPWREGAAARTSRSYSPISTEAILEEMNLHRRRYGLAPLSLNRKLNLAATDRVRDMFEQRYFDHVSPDGTEPFVWAKARGYRYATIGENLAEGQRSAREVVDGWMNSPGHRANILGASFEECGLAIAQGSPTGRTRGYTFVALYAREARSRSRG